MSAIIQPDERQFDEGRLMKCWWPHRVSEKATMVADKSNAVTFKVHARRHQARNQGRRGTDVQGGGQGRFRHQRQGQDQAFCRSIGRRDHVRAQGLRDLLKEGQERTCLGRLR